MFINDHNISLNSCKIEKYKIGHESEKAGRKIHMADILQDAIEYAYTFDPKKFEEYYNSRKDDSFLILRKLQNLPVAEVLRGTNIKLVY